jgi:hypothetical protein
MASILTSLGYQIVLNTKFATVNVDVLKATSASGLQLQDDGGNLGIFVEDGGSVGIGNATPDGALQVTNHADGWTSSGWKKSIRLDSLGALWWPVASGLGWGIGANSNGNFYIGKSTVDNDTAAAKYPMYFTGTHIVCYPSGVVGSGIFFISDSANSKMTNGITINQGANDNEILAFKSSDVAHGVTALIETDTYAAWRKEAAAEGGLQLRTGSEANVSYRHIADAAGAGDTTKSTVGRAAVEFDVRRSNAGVASNVNLFCIKNNQGTRFIVDEDGDTWQLGVMTAASLVLGSTALSEANLIDLTDGGSTTLHSHAGGGDAIADADGDTKVQVEETGDEDIIRFDAAASEVGVWDATSLTMGLQPCFSAYAAAMTDLAINTNHTITYSGERFDTGGDYNTSTYTFTAPATGKYLLIASIFGLQADTSATYYRISIITSNLTYFVTESPGRWDSDPAYYHMKCVAIADMDTSDTAYVTIRQQGGGAQLDISASQSESLFMGYKLS